MLALVTGVSADTVALKCHIRSHFESEGNVTDSLAHSIIQEKPVPCDLTGNCMMVQLYLYD